jgi:serine/threonine protein kinase
MQGSEANTLLAQHGTHGTWRVVKGYRPGVPVRPEVVERVRGWGEDEQRDRHLVGVEQFEVGTNALMEEESQWYEVQEYCEDGSVRDLVATEGPALPTELVEEIVRQVAAAITYFHELGGLAHRDLKPDNVLIRSRGSLDVVLGDFNLAVLPMGSLAFASRSATPNYAAPELVANREASTAMDYWSLGVMVHELLTGYTPLAGLARQAIENAASHGRVVDLEQITDRRWRQLCAGLLTVDRAHRWGAEELADWLGGGEPAVAEPAVSSRAAPGHGSAAPYELLGWQCTSASELARALTCDKRHWDEGCKRLGRGDLLTWLRNNNFKQDLINHIQDLDNAYPDINVRLFHFVLTLDPTLPPSYRGFDLSLTGLEGLTSDAQHAADNPRRLARDIVHHLYTHQLLTVYGEQSETDSYIELDRRWHDNVNKFEAVQEYISQQLNTDDIPDDLRGRAIAVLLHTTLDDTAAEALRDRAHAATTHDAQQQPWFTKLGDPDTTSLANCYAITVFADDAEATTAQQREEHRQEQEKRERLERQREERERRIHNGALVATGKGMAAWIAAYAPVSWLTSLAVEAFAPESPSAGIGDSFAGLWAITLLFSVPAGLVIYKWSLSNARILGAENARSKELETASDVLGAVLLSPFIGAVIFGLIGEVVELGSLAAEDTIPAYQWFSAPLAALGLLIYNLREKNRDFRRR